MASRCWLTCCIVIALSGCAISYETPSKPVNVRGKWELEEEIMATLTDNGDSNTITLSPGEAATAEGEGTWGSGTATLYVQSKADDSTWIPCTQIDGTNIAFTANFAVGVRNFSGVSRKYKLTLSGATSPNLELLIE